jgi:hypothetical protein
MSDNEKALAYYRAATEGRRPNFVPARVKLASLVRGDGPFAATRVPAGEYTCQANQWGAVSLLATNGQLLGVKPSEFEVLAWCENPAGDPPP